ncbi:MAG TPA: YfaZ family outer membrane protein [Steroidobacter sp.]|uniref:YfaZ family outer membrane protein n=1 Tax=Steroidobacter sp. TaxID=1978227 RepID=UPI002EDA8B1A
MIRLLTALVLTGCALALFPRISQAQNNEEYDSIGELALSNDTLQLRYQNDGDLFGMDDSILSGAFFLSEERDTVFSAGVGFPTGLPLGPVSLHVGPQVYAALLNDENEDILSIGVGAAARWVVLSNLGLGIAGHAYYAPDILTFGSADNLTDLMARVELGLQSRVLVFGGMRWFEFDLTEGEGERTLQEEVFVGFGYRF